MKYDLNGNLTNDSRRVLTYDDENHLTAVIATNASGLVTKSEFVYDGKMRRRIRKEYTLASGIWNLVSEVRYIYDGMLVVQERHFQPQVSTTIPQQSVTYTRGRDLSGTLEGAGGIGGLLARSEMSNLQSPHAYYHADGNGNITSLIATNSVILARYLYDPYGNTLSQNGSLADANLYRFSSKEWHGASGLVYYGYRFYAPEWQRWVNRDPIGEAGGANLFGYIYNKPLSLVDPRGLSWWSIFVPGRLLKAAALAADIALDACPNLTCKEGPCKACCGTAFAVGLAAATAAAVFDMAGCEMFALAGPWGIGACVAFEGVLLIAVTAKLTYDLNECLTKCNTKPTE
jgi:RHS repeat-associated protein